jgi:hypothetical protein
MAEFPTIRQVVLDTADVRGLAEFYRRMFGLTYRPGDERPAPGEPDPRGDDWLVLRAPGGGIGLAFQQVDDLKAPTWPDPTVPQQLHLDTSVQTMTELDIQTNRAIELGARVIQDRSDDPEEPIRVFGDPSGHPFCIFVTP